MKSLICLVKIIQKNTSQGEYDKTLCTDTKAHELLGWKPTKNINDYIKDFVNNQK